MLNLSKGKNSLMTGLKMPANVSSTMRRYQNGGGVNAAKSQGGDKYLASFHHSDLNFRNGDYVNGRVPDTSSTHNGAPLPRNNSQESERAQEAHT